MKRSKHILVVLAAFLLYCAMALPVAASSIPSSAKTYNGHSYKAFNKGYTWAQAERYCQALGGHLVTITSAEEQEFVKTLADAAGRNCYWTGGRLTSDKKWTWNTKEAFSFTNWAVGQPDNLNNRENRLMIYGNTNAAKNAVVGSWNDVNSTSNIEKDSFYSKKNFGFICEWDLPSFSQAKVSLSCTKYSYSGKEKKPAVVVSLAGTKRRIILKKDRDYTVTYSNNINPGKATVTVTGKGNYAGTVSKTFTIVPRRPTAFSIARKEAGQLAVSWNVRKEAQSYEIQYSTSYRFKKANTVTVSVTPKQGETKVTQVLSGLTKGKRYYVRIRSCSNDVKGYWNVRRSGKVL